MKRFGFVLLAGLALAATPLTGSPWIIEQEKLLAADMPADSYFGSAVAVSDDTAIVGAYEVNGEMGAAYVFARTGAGWFQQANLVPSDRAQEERMLFGTSVAISGETAFVAAYGGHPTVSSGAVYVFVRNGSSWSEQAKLIAPDSYDFDLFAASLAISGDTLVVGAPGGDSAQTSQPRGAVYVFVRGGSSWSLQAKLLASNGNAWDGFGGSVAISGDTLIVGGSNNAVGAVYVFRRSGSIWREQTLLRPADWTASDSFGRRFSLSGNTLVVAAPGADFDAEDVGAVYVFVDNGSSWSEQAKLRASDGETDDLFGCETALSGDTLVVGAYGDNNGKGKAYLFVRNGSTWSEHARLHASDGEPWDIFGAGVAISGRTALVGAHSADDPGVAEDVGAAYLFSAPGVRVAPTSFLVTQDSTPFSVTLDTPPAGDVVIDLASSNVNEGTVTPTQLTFTPGDWSTPRTATLTRVAESGPPYTIALSVNQDLTTDAFYDDVDPEDVSAVPIEWTGDFYTVASCRALDTRQPDQGPPLTAGLNRIVTFHGTCEVPATARAVAVTVTVAQPAPGVHLILYPSGLPYPGLHLTYGAGPTRSISTIVPLATDGTGTLTVAPLVTEGGSADLVIDVSGYFE